MEPCSAGISICFTFIGTNKQFEFDLSKQPATQRWVHHLKISGCLLPQLIFGIRQKKSGVELPFINLGFSIFRGVHKVRCRISMVLNLKRYI